MQQPQESFYDSSILHQICNENLSTANSLRLTLFYRHLFGNEKKLALVTYANHGAVSSAVYRVGQIMFREELEGSNNSGLWQGGA
jgi:hypothetical protein